MEIGDSKHWAKEYILDPLNAPEPSEETGPGSSFRPEAAKPLLATPASPTSSTNPFRRNTLTKTRPSATSTPISDASARSDGQRSPPTAFPDFQKDTLPSSPSHRQEAFGSTNEPARRRRGSSLNERFPGDKSHRPLEQLTKEKALADRSKHVTRKHHVKPDTIDRLDGGIGGSFHHGGPYDATLAARNSTQLRSPVAAVADSNREALRATPREKLMDSLERHRPLDGVASYAPGETDQNGHTYRYASGENMMTDLNPEGGAYKRWPGIQYHPDDIKGKGEPSYTVEKELKKHDADLRANGQRAGSQTTEGIEMTSRPRRSQSQTETKVGRTGSLSQHLGGGSLRKRMGSIKKHFRDE